MQIAVGHQGKKFPLPCIHQSKTYSFLKDPQGHKAQSKFTATEDADLIHFVEEKQLSSSRLSLICLFMTFSFQIAKNYQGAVEG